MNDLEIRTLSSLEKVFPDADPGALYTAGTSLRGEVFSFQVAYRAHALIKRLHVQWEAGALTPYLQVYAVGMVPSEMPGYGDEDDWVLRTAPGLYPDPIYPLTKADEIYAYPRQWRSLFCSVSVPKDFAPGQYPIHVTISGVDDSTFGGEKEWTGEVSFALDVLPPVLPRQTIRHTEWFSSDCIATWYGLEPLSDAWWTMTGKYIANAVRHGINMILTPLFTPPIETKIGSERPTVQLVQISKQGARYSFSFEWVGKWLEICKNCGAEYFEMPHLFTQWGARCAPKIIVTENGEKKNLFGWAVSSESEAYLDFLRQFLPALLRFMERKVPLSHLYFHISDEPGEDSIERYTRLSAFVRGLIGDCPLIDAMSSLPLFKASRLTSPVTATDEIQAFLDSHVENLWAYYACLQYKNHLANRFFAMPSSRNRVLGFQLYKNNISGFLHWGYNHWYSGLSAKRLNPWETTDADACFPSGDAFLVYPGANGPVNSLRIAVLREAFQDHRALCLLEDMTSREHALETLEAGIAPVSFTEYPTDAAWLLDVRSRINRELSRLYREGTDHAALS